MGATVNAGDVVNEGERAEIAYHALDSKGNERLYEWECYLPTDFTDPDPGEFLHVAQWHDWPEDGDWSDYPRNSPSISCDYEYVVVSTLDSSITNYFDTFFPTWNSLVIADRLPVWFATVGTEVPKETIAIIPFAKGTWQKIGFQIKWSFSGSGGHVKVFHNNTLIGISTEDNMYFDYPHFFKCGVYRAPQAFSQTVLFDNINIGAATIS